MFLIAGETNSLVAYHLMTEGHWIQLGVWGSGCLVPQQVQGSALLEGWNFFETYFEYRP